MIADAEAKGGSATDVDSIYLRGEEAILEHERRNGYDKEIGDSGVSAGNGGKVLLHPNIRKHVVV